MHCMLDMRRILTGTASTKCPLPVLRDTDLSSAGEAIEKKTEVCFLSTVQCTQLPQTVRVMDTNYPKNRHVHPNGFAIRWMSAIIYRLQLTARATSWQTLLIVLKVIISRHFFSFTMQPSKINLLK